MLPTTRPDFVVTNTLAVAALSDWLAADETRQKVAGNYYTQRLAQGRLFTDAELTIAQYCSGHFDRQTKFVELGFGFGELSILLALSGFDATGYESDAGRHAGATALVAALATRKLKLGNLSLIHGRFPEALRLAELDTQKAVLVATNVTSDYIMRKMDLIHRAIRLFDHVILDLARFGTARDHQAQLDLVEDLRRCGLVEVTPIYSSTHNSVRHFQRAVASAAEAGTPMPEPLRYSDIGSPVPSLLLTAPCYIFDQLEIPASSIFPRLATIPSSWLPQKPIRIANVGGTLAALGLPSFHEGEGRDVGRFVFPRFGGYRINCSFGVFKCLLLDPAMDDDQRAIEIFRFATENIVHSNIDRATIVPWARRSRHIRPDLLLQKLFLSDQPLGLHCDNAAEITAYLLHLNRYKVRGISLVDETETGHVVLEVLLPGRGKWIMLDPDFGVIITDRDGVALGTEEIVAGLRQKRDLIVDCVVEKRWATGEFNVGNAYTGQIAFLSNAHMSGATVRDGSYNKMMERYYHVRREMTYRFEAGFADIRSEPMENRKDLPEPDQ